MTACRYDRDLGYRVTDRGEPCTQRHCCVGRCDGHVLARGWCNAHYHRWLRTGDPLPPYRPDLRERVLARLDIRAAGYDTPCWLSTRAVGTNGYTHIKLADRRNVLLHRLVYELFVGSIPDGLTIDHLCRNKTCINPAHLEAVTQQINSRRHYGAAS